MNILEALLHHNIRVSNGDRWLVRDEMYLVTGEFVVYECPRYARKTKEIYRGMDEEEAVRILIGEENE